MKHLVTKSLCLSLLVISFSFAAKDLKDLKSYVQAAAKGRCLEWSKNTELAKLINSKVPDKVKVIIDTEAGVEITAAVIEQLTHGYTGLDTTPKNLDATVKKASTTLVRELIIRYGTKALAKVGLSTESIENKIKEMSPVAYEYLALITKYSLKIVVDVAVDKGYDSACSFVPKVSENDND